VMTVVAPTQASAYLTSSKIAAAGYRNSAVAHHRTGAGRAVAGLARAVEM